MVPSTALAAQISSALLPATGVTLFGQGLVPISNMAIRQAEIMAELPGVVYAMGMPDLHACKSVPNGFVLGTEGMVVPAAVGRDINCGIRLMRTNLHRDEIDREALEQIAQTINLGQRWGHVQLTGPDVEAVLAGGVSALSNLSAGTRSAHPVWDLLDTAYLQHERDHIEEAGSLPGDPAAVARSHQKIGARQMGTLGSGNHFLEFQTVETLYDATAAEALGITRGDIVLMIHTGSRGLGHNVATQFMHKAQAAATHRPNALKEVYAVPAESTVGQEYLQAHNAAANYGYVNRLMLGALTLLALRKLDSEVSLGLAYDISHNMVKCETHGGQELYVHRKGAARALPPSRMTTEPLNTIGQPVVIPGSMGTASYLLTGTETGSRSLYSVNHGAGRVLPRSKAAGQRRRQVHNGREEREIWKARISAREFRRTMRGVLLAYSDGKRLKGNADVRRDGLPIIEEAPQAYKDVDDTVDVLSREQLARPVARMRPVAVLKEG